MAVKVVIGPGEIPAAIKDRRWYCRDKETQKLLTAMTKARPFKGYEPYPDLAIARDAVKEFGGKVVEYDELEYVDGREY